MNSTTQLSLFNPDLEPIRYIAEHGTFELTYDGQFKTFWLSQKQIAELFNITQQAVSFHVLNFKKSRPEDVATCYKDDLYQDRNGQTRHIELYNHQVVVFIGYRANLTEEAVRFQRFVEKVLQERLQAEFQRTTKQASTRRAQKITRYIQNGYTPERAELRADGMDIYRELAANITKVTDARAIGQALNHEYVSLFGKVARQLREILESKSVRDALPALQLKYVQLAEDTLNIVLSEQDKLSQDELFDIVVKTVKPLGEHLRMVCEVSGIDLVTGRKLLS